MVLELENLEIRRRNLRLFSPLSLTVQRGEIVTVMGPSGCGKSTLLAAIAGNLEHVFRLHGQIRLNGRELCGISMERRRVGILFQDDLLFPHFDVWGNLAFALPAALSREQRRQRIREVLERAGLADFAHRDVATLSGGQRARVSLLRTMVAEPEAVLLDEPFSRLDKPLRASFREFVHEQVATLDIPALLVTHDVEDSCGGQVYQLAGGEA